MGVSDLLLDCALTSWSAADAPAGRRSSDLLARGLTTRPTSTTVSMLAGEQSRRLSVSDAVELGFASEGPWSGSANRWNNGGVEAKCLCSRPLGCLDAIDLPSLLFGCLEAEAPCNSSAQSTRISALAACTWQFAMVPSRHKGSTEMPQ